MTYPMFSCPNKTLFFCIVQLFFLTELPPFLHGSVFLATKNFDNFPNQNVQTLSMHICIAIITITATTILACFVINAMACLSQRQRGYNVLNEYDDKSFLILNLIIFVIAFTKLALGFSLVRNSKSSNLCQNDECKSNMQSLKNLGRHLRIISCPNLFAIYLKFLISLVIHLNYFEYLHKIKNHILCWTISLIFFFGFIIIVTILFRS